MESWGLPLEEQFGPTSATVGYVGWSGFFPQIGET